MTTDRRPKQGGESDVPGNQDDKTPPAAQPMLIDARQVAEILGRSTVSVRRDDLAGRLPSPVRIGGSKKWRREEITAWVRSGCPSRSKWQARIGKQAMLQT